MLAVQDVKTGYVKSGSNGPVALHRLQFDVPANQVLLVAGRNGVGKSSLILTLAGLHPPLEGAVLVNNQNIHAVLPEERAALVSVMFSTPPDLNLTKTQEVVLTSMQRNFSRWQWRFDKELEKVRECFEICGIDNLWDREFNRISDGEKQKVMLARCLAQDTPFIILDEPMAFLDYPSRRALLELINRLCTQNGKTIVFTSHDLDISLQYCDLLLLLEPLGVSKLYTNKAEISNMQAAALFGMAEN